MNMRVRAATCEGDGRLLKGLPNVNTRTAQPAAERG